MSDQANTCPKCGAKKVIHNAGNWGDAYACGNYDRRPVRPPLCEIRQRDQLIAVLLAACRAISSRGIGDDTLAQLRSAIARAEAAGFEAADAVGGGA